MPLSYLPRARRKGLRIQIVADETLLYDMERDQAIVLNPTAAFVWNNADGARSVSDIASALSESFQTPVDPRVVWYAIEQLSNKNLLVERAPIPAAYAHLKRRDLLSKAGLLGAALAIPVVVSMMAPTPAHAASCGLLPNGGACTQHFDCCSDCCAGFVCTSQSACI